MECATEEVCKLASAAGCMVDKRPSIQLSKPEGVCLSAFRLHKGLPVQVTQRTGGDCTDFPILAVAALVSHNSGDGANIPFMLPPDRHTLLFLLGFQGGPRVCY